MELEKHFPDYMLFQPLLLHEIQDYKMEVTDIHYNTTDSLLYVGYSTSSETGSISSYISSITALWESTNMGAFAIYHMSKSNYGEINMHRSYLQRLPSQVAKIKYIDDLNINMVLIGLYDGTIIVNKIYANQLHLSKHLVEEVVKFRIHKNKILDIGFDVSTGYLYTAALGEKNINIYEINYQTLIKSLPLSNAGITKMSYQKESKRMFLTDANNSIWLFQIEDNVK